METLLKAVESGGSVALIMTILLVLVWRFWVKQLEKKEEQIKELIKDYEDKIKSIVKDHAEIIKEKDALLESIRNEIQELLINDTTVKTRLTDTITNLVQLIQSKF